MTRALATLALSAGVIANPVLAQKTATGTLIPDRESASMVEEIGMPSGLGARPTRSDIAQRRANAGANQTMRGFTECLVTSADDRREHAALVSFLSASPESEQASDLGRRLSRPGCLYGAGADYVSLHFSSDLLRGGLFRALYLDTQRTPPRTKIERREIESVWKDQAQGNFGGLLRFGECVVAANGSAANAYLVARVDSIEQRAAVQKLGPALSTCLKPGVTIQFSRMALEAMLAEALYRQATAAIPTVGKP